MGSESRSCLHRYIKGRQSRSLFIEKVDRAEASIYGYDSDKEETVKLQRCVQL